ncbi:MAG: hypothetical protein GF416_03570 [Candidatus Altiarchaeales archaeon]|nr:hypothetical protein [Candidatus Altiarchaeales archaeon]MBD3416198.1 hypothetical protein [Candidatus Altiarchaeales archaeon]
MRAPLGRRVLAFLIDVGVAFLALLAFLAMGYVLGLIADSAIVVIAQMLMVLGGSIAFLGYALARDGIMGGRSVGKKALGLRVVKCDGSRCDLVSSGLRNISFIIPVVGVVELLLPVVDAEGLRLGDKIAGTQVVV